MKVTVPYDRPWGHAKVISEFGGQAIELVFDRRVNQVKLRAVDTGWLVSHRGEAGEDVGEAGVPLDDDAWTAFPDIKWDPASGLVSRLFVQADGPGKVLHVVAWTD